MKKKLFVIFGITATMFDEESYFSSVIDFNPHWDYKHRKEYISQKNINLSAIGKFHLKLEM